MEQGVGFELVPVKVTDDFRKMYDAAADLWQEVYAVGAALVLVRCGCMRQCAAHVQRWRAFLGWHASRGCGL